MLGNYHGAKTNPRYRTPLLYNTTPRWCASSNDILVLGDIMSLVLNGILLGIIVLLDLSELIVFMFFHFCSLKRSAQSRPGTPKGLQMVAQGLTKKKEEEASKWPTEGPKRTRNWRYENKTPEQMK